MSDSNTRAPDGRDEALQPAWRRDFPIDWAQDHYVARRDFTKFMVLTSFAFTVGQFWIGIQNWFRQRRGQPPVRAIARLDEVPVGGTVPFAYPGDNDKCLLVRPAEDVLLAYGQECTHLSCAVVPDLPTGRFHCPCHKGYFDVATGRPLAGPPRRPLPRVTLETRAGVIYATGVEVATV